MPVYTRNMCMHVSDKNGKGTEQIGLHFNVSFERTFIETSICLALKMGVNQYYVIMMACVWSNYELDISCR